jgi:cyclophilin family peptidyl-prolyl cis-trans isomerase
VLAAGAITYGVLRTGGGTKAVKPGQVTTATTRAVAVAAPCPPVSGSPTRRTSFAKPPPSCLEPGRAYSASVVTDLGTFTIALAKSDPVVVNDFVYLARYQFYKGLIFHRVIPGFVVQGGDPNPIVPSAPQGPGYTVQGLVPKAGAYKLGTVAMAKTASQPAGAAGSQFFVVVGKAGEALPPDYAVLGQVTSGMSVVDKLEAAGTASGRPKIDNYIISMTIFSS